MSDADTDIETNKSCDTGEESNRSQDTCDRSTRSQESKESKGGMLDFCLVRVEYLIDHFLSNEGSVFKMIGS